MGILTLLRNAFGRSRKGRIAEEEPSRETAAEVTPIEATSAKPSVPAPAAEPEPAVAEPAEPTASADIPAQSSARKSSGPNEHDLVAAAFDNVTVPRQMTPQAETAIATNAEPEAEAAEPEAEAAEPEAEAAEAAEPLTEAEAEPTVTDEPKAEAAPEPEDTEPEAETEPEPEPEPADEVTPEPAAEVTAEPEAEAGAAQAPEPEAAAETEAIAEVTAEPEAETEPEPKAEAIAEVTAEPEAETEPEPEAETEPEPEAEVTAEPEAEAGVAQAPETEPEAIAEVTAEPADEVTPEPASAPEPEPAAEVAAEPEPEPQAEEAGTQPEAQPQAEPLMAEEPADAPVDAPAAVGGEQAPQAAEGEIREESEPVGPAVALTRVKSHAPGLTTAYEAAATVLDQHGLTGARARVYLVLDRSASMRPYYKDGSAQALGEQALALAAHLDPEAAVHVAFFSTELDGTGELTLAEHENKIDEFHSGLGRMGRTSYHVAVEAVVTHHEKSSDPALPALVIFQTDGAPDTKTPATQALTAAAKDHPAVFFSFVAFGDPENKAFDYLRKLKTGNTAHFLAGETPRELTDTEVYEGVLANWRP